MDSRLENACNDLWLHLTTGKLAWLFGAGVSFNAGIPLMYPLTDYVRTLISEELSELLPLLDAVQGQLREGCHVEHILSQLGDLIALARRSRTQSTVVGDLTATVDDFEKLHSAVLSKIARAVRYGYRPANGSTPEKRGTPSEPIVTVDDHCAFVRRLFAARVRPGIQQSAITFFTSNYDTLLEDALALEQLSFQDGFLGGGMGYWAPEISFSDVRFLANARIFKLHGSVDWHRGPGDAIIRCRDGCQYPPKTDRLLIYPQSTKYVATQKDPFAKLFGYFRSTLASGPDNVLAICGYSFGDDHINGEIEGSLNDPHSKTVILAFVEEREAGGTWNLPKRLQAWLSNPRWRERIFVASNRGLYHGSLENLSPEGSHLTWWTIQGLTQYLADGPEIVPSTPEADLTVTEPVEEAAS